MRELILVSMVLTAVSTTARSEDIKGEWARSDGLARVIVSPCGDALCAVNTWVKDPSGGEKIGDKLVMSVAPIDQTTMKGEAFDPQRNLRIGVEINMASSKQMTTKGCVLGGMLCKDMGWTRIEKAVIKQAAKRTVKPRAVTASVQ
jgi:uncharacterized protein (DUF2147 family)